MRRALALGNRGPGGHGREHGCVRERPVRERVLLKLPVGRSPPRGAILEARVRVTEPSPERNGFDERAWLAHQGIHVVLRASDWRQVGRRGGILGLGDRLRERVERAVSRGTSGVRRGVVLGVVLGEDEDLSAGARNDFRASGLYHLLRLEGRNGLLRECSGMSLERCRSNLDTELWSGFGRVA